MAVQQRQAGARPGPYDGPGTRVVGLVPPSIRRVVTEAGGMSLLLVQVIGSIVRHPGGFWKAALDDFYITLRRATLPMAAAIFGFLLFFSLVTIIFFNQAGAVAIGSALLYLYGFRAFTVFVVAVVVSGIAGAALTADIGARKIRDELDAMRVMGLDPVRELVVPRVVSLTALTTIVVLPGLAVSAVALQLGASYYGHLSAAEYYQNLFAALQPIEMVSCLINCFVLGVLISVVCCYKGLTASGGAIGVGRAVNHAVVVCYVALFVFQLGYNAVFLGLYPEIGTLR